MRAVAKEDVGREMENKKTTMRKHVAARHLQLHRQSLSPFFDTGTIELSPFFII